METDQAVSEIESILNQGKSLLSNGVTDEGFYRARISYGAAIDRLAPAGSQYLRDKERETTKCAVSEIRDSTGRWATLRVLESILDTLRSDYSAGRIKVEKPSDIPGLLHVEKILSRFHLVALQLKQRHESRPTLEILNEYDVQDLLHSLLRLFFDDIRSEENTPSFAGKSSRMDLLLKAQRIVVEVKMTREKLADKEIGDQLSLDIARYRAHPDCNVLICFVYDPARRIQNATGLRNDLELLSSDDLAVMVQICQS